MNDTVRRCLEDLEERLDPADEERIVSEWSAFTEGGFRGDIFTPLRSRPLPPRVAWPDIRVNAALQDYDAMVLQQYGAVSATLERAGGAMLDVRSNYGSSIAPLLFGVQPFVMADELNTLPTSIPLNDEGAVRRLLDAGVPDLSSGYGAQVLEMGHRYVEIGKTHPRIRRYVNVYHPDLQGPMDICEVLWGSSIYVALYEQRDLVKALLELVCETYIAFLNKWLEIVPFRQGPNTHWGLMHAGNIMLRDDSAMNLSPAMFEDYVRPYDQRLLDTFGGGAIHFCGRGDHYIGSMCEMEGMHAIAMSQPEYNDMERIYRATVDRGIKLIGLRRSEAERALAAGRDLHGQVHCTQPTAG